MKYLFVVELYTLRELGVGVQVEFINIELIIFNECKPNDYT